MRLTENLEIVWPGTPTNFPRQWLGYDEDRLLYTYFQVSPDHPQGWAGMETFQRPAFGVPVSYGYGALPLRIWGRDFIAEADGSVAAGAAFMSPRVYLSPPAYHQDSGGIHPSLMVRDAYVERTPSGDLRFVSPAVPGGLTLYQIATGQPAPPPVPAYRSGGGLALVLAALAVVALCRAKG